MPGAKLGHIPSYTKENKSEDGRHVRIGNMLQIVPTDPEKSRPSPKQSLASPMAAAMVPPPAAVASGSAVVPEENTKANELLRKLEEQKKIKEAERRQRREQRLAERAELQKKQLEDLSITKDEVPRENDNSNSSNHTSSGRILETIEREEDHEARILAEAMTSVPEEDHDLNEDEEEIEDVQSMSSAERKLKSKKQKGDDVRYISLKPFSKKERKRQAKNNVETSEPIDEFEEEEEEFVKRSPVPLPDPSTLKSILHAVGFTNKQDTIKKMLKYADGVLPGQGSPDHHNEVTEPSPPSLQSNR